LTVSDVEFELHDELRWYAGVVKAITPEDAEYGPRLKWVIDLDEDPDDREQWAWCSQKLSPKSKLYSWVKALLGRAPEPGAEVDLEGFVGRRVAVMFEQYTDSDGNTRDKVTTIVGEERAFPAHQAAAVAVPPADVPPPSEADEPPVDAAV
jgi:hypothetical protein